MERVELLWLDAAGNVGPCVFGGPGCSDLGRGDERDGESGWSERDRKSIIRAKEIAGGRST